MTAKARECPCIRCPVHRGICHALCREYKEWEAQHAADEQELYKFRHTQGQLIGHAIDTAERLKKRRGKGK